MTNTTLSETQIRETAYLCWLDEGQPEGRDQAHWLKAIDILTPTTTGDKPKRKTKVAGAAGKPKAKPRAKPKARTKKAATK
ncbi:hypothetical protein NBRC116601_29560 [Cognatishimia sp. WU-CL00825]|uniref:DUF2934 domain-containing protein n=1 Tax=Cognatishimia sp. WU-CL00825 TaxID=3127658 RepID=UPI00310468CD